MAVLPLDLTGSLTTNYIRDEEKLITREADRYFVPMNGAFYGDLRFRIYNNASGALLEPNTQYRLLHLVEDAVKISYKNVYAVVYIVDKTVTSVRFDYQAVGGVYQNIATSINEHLEEYLLGTTGTNMIGAVVGVPVQVAPEHHLQALDDFQGAGALVSMMEKIRQAVLMGNAPAFAAAYEYINERFSNAISTVNQRVAETLSQVEIIEQRTQIQNGDYHITSNPANPSTYLGYGNWVLDTNMLLFGSGTGADIGEYINVGIGEGGHVAIRRYFWRRDDNASGATYQLTANKSNLNEGDTVRITLTTTGLAAGTKVAYKITGVTASDLVNQPLNGEFTIASNGTAFIDVNVRQDMATEGVEVMRVALTAMPNISVDVTINDTSLAPSYTIKFSGSANGAGEVSSVNEGSTIYIALHAEGVEVGTKLYLLYNDSTVSENDIVGNVFTAGHEVTLDSALSAIVPIEIKADALTEGNETLVVNVCTTNNINSRVVRGVITVNDTSKSPASNLRFATNSSGTNVITTVNEGVAFYAVIGVDNIPDGTPIDIIYGGTASADDFTTNLVSTVTVSGSQAIIPFATRNDVATEGDEVLILGVYHGGQKLTEGSIIIKDTSLNPTYNLRFSSNANGTDVIGNANEGTTAYLCLNTSNVTNGKVFTVEYSGTSDAADITGTRPLSLNITNNAASAALIIKADTTTEGAETLVATVKDGTVVIGTATLTINDTSASPTATIRFSSNASGSNTITQTNEGQTVYAIIETTNVNNSEVLQVTHGGSAIEADFTLARATSVTVSSNKASLELAISNDLKSEGEETYNLTVKLPDGKTVTSGNLRIIDTSVPTLNVYFSGANTGIGQITNINEGQTAYLVIETTGFTTDGSISANINYSGTILAADLTTGTLPENTALNNARTIVPFAFKEDYMEDGDKTLTVSVSINGDTIPAKSTTLSVGDISKFGTMTAAGNVVIPAGKVMRGFLIGPSAVSGVNGVTAKQLGETAVTINDTRYPLIAAGSGSAVGYYNGTSGIYNGTSQPSDGRTFDTVLDEARGGWVIDTVNDDVEDPDAETIAAGGLVQLVRVPGITALNTESNAVTLNFSNLSTNIKNQINNLTKSFVGPTVYDSANAPGNPGRAAGNNVLAFVYVNNSDEDITIPVSFTAKTISAGTYGTSSQFMYEIHDTYTKARLGHKPSRIYSPADTGAISNNFQVDANKRYAFLVISGGGYVGTKNDSYLVENVTIEFPNRETVVIPAGSSRSLTGTWHNAQTMVPAISLPRGIERYQVINLNELAVGAADSKERLNTWTPVVNLNPRIVPFVPTLGSNGNKILPTYGIPAQYQSVRAQPGNAVLFTTDKSTTARTFRFEFSGHTKYADTVDPNTVHLPLTATVSGTDSGYNVVRAFNIYNQFVSTQGREPTAADSITLEIPANYAFVGDTSSTAGIMIDSRCSVFKNINIINRGLISGVGGSGGIGSADIGINGGVTGRTQAGPGIQNDSTKTFNVLNYGTIAGGGGFGGFAGGSLVVTVGGSGGAPYGRGSYINGLADRKGNDATLLSPGISVSKGNDFPIGGNGGAWGQPGTKGGGTSGMDGGPAGYHTIGSLRVVNLGSGKLLGRANSSTSGPLTNITVPVTQVTDSGYNITRGFNLYDRFVEVTGRSPLPNEKITLTVPSAYALVGNETVPFGLYIDSRCDAFAEIQITNNGLISGMGGNGTVTASEPAHFGYTGIKNDSSTPVIVTNTGTIAGGGGGGLVNVTHFGFNIRNYGGGGGAPYGKGGAGNRATGTNAGLLTGGVGHPDDVNGRGGNLGMPGGSAPGYSTEGNVIVVNEATGSAIGRVSNAATGNIVYTGREAAVIITELVD